MPLLSYIEKLSYLISQAAAYRADFANQNAGDYPQNVSHCEVKRRD